MRNKKEKITSMLIGGIVGDALGVPYEFMKRGELKIDPCKEMRGEGTHNQPLGTWSDDTSLTLALIDSIIDKKGFDIDKFAENSARWLNNAEFTAHGKVFDIGIATSRALHKYISGTKPELCGGSNISDNGNGALMRIHPLLVLLNDNMSMDEKFELIKTASCLTHNHNISHIACLFYLELLSNILKDYNKTTSYGKAYYNVNTFLLSKPELVQYIETFEKVSDDISKLEEKYIASSGYVVHSLEASIWCFLTSYNYKEAVLKAVNLGDDTDTIASITGVIAGMYYGEKSIPVEWIESIAKKEHILVYIDKISEIVK